MQDYSNTSSTKGKHLTYQDRLNIERWYNKEVIKQPVYYAHAYASYERGSNEDRNRMIRRHLPKGQQRRLLKKSPLSSLGLILIQEKC
jgi:IS30 family transposase